jgi:hypothetical protein
MGDKKNRGSFYCGGAVMNAENICKEIQDVETAIEAAERDLLQTAPDNIKTLYLKIDFLCCKQKNLEEKLSLG